MVFFFRGFVFVMMIRNDRSFSLAGVSVEKTWEQDETTKGNVPVGFATKVERDGRGGTRREKNVAFKIGYLCLSCFSFHGC